MQTSIDQDRRNFAHIAAWCVLVMLLLKFLISLLNNSLYTWIGHLAVETSAFLMCAILIVEKISRNSKTKAINQILALFNRAPCGYHSLDANGLIIGINQTELDWLGYTYADVVNRMKFTDLIDESGLATFQENFPKLKVLGLVNELSFDLIAKNGTRRSVLISSIATFDQNGNFQYTHSAVFDISQHKKLEEEIKVATALIKNLYDQAPCGYHSLDPNGLVIEINQTELDWLGYTYEEVVNKMHVSDLFYAGNPALFQEYYPKLKKEGFVHELSFNLVAKDGTLRPVLLSSVAHYDSEGNYHHSLSTVFDISQRKKLEEELRESQAKATLKALRIYDLYNNAPCAYYSTDAWGLITEMNQTALDWLGYTYEEVINKMTIFDLVDEETTNQLLSLGPELIEKGFVHEFTCDLIAKDGTRRPVLANSIFMFDENGNFQSTRSTAIDITQRKKLEEELKTASALIKDLYNYAPCGYQSTNAEGIIIEMNQTALDWLGYTYEEVVGKMKVSELVDEQTFDMFLELFPEFVRTGEIREIGIDVIRKDGTRLPILFSTLARYDENGNFHSTRATLFDITQRKKLEKELRAANEAANLARISQEHFLANMSHEIRTPMNAILGFTEILEKSELDDRQKQFVKFIRTASENLLVIINDILDLSKIEAGMLRIETTSFSLLSLLHSIDAMLQIRTAEKNLHLNLQVEPNLPDMLLGDPTRLTQILTNLIGNAIKFTKKGTVDLKVKVIEKFADNIILQFSIKDTGIGITESQLEYIFDRFEQGDKTTSRLYGGTGLGLSICKRLVDLQGGSIHVTSEPEVGSEFVFTLPYQLPLVEIAEPAIDKAKNPAEPPSPSNPGHGGHILIVEDNLMNRTLIRFLMEEWSFEYELAENGEIALEKLRNKQFDLVLMDIQMPGIDGYQTTQIIRNELQLTLPIIAMTAHAFSGERAKCLNAGMNDYITKPLRQAELRMLLLKYMEQDRND